MKREIDLCQYDEKEVEILAGSHHKIIINKLYGPACVPDIVIEWDGEDWKITRKEDDLK